MNKQKKDTRWTVTVALMMAIVILLANTPLASGGCSVCRLPPAW